MSEEVVRVVVEQTGRGSSVKDTARDLDDLRRKARATVEAENPQTVAKIKELNETAAKYEARAAREDINPSLRQGAAQAAKSVRAEAGVLQKDLTRATAEQLVHEKAIRAEHLAQNAVLKQQEAAAAKRAMRFGVLGRAGAAAVERIAGESPFSGTTSALSQLGGPVALTAAVSAAVVGSLLAADAARTDKFRQLALADTSGREADARSVARQRGFEGNSGGLRKSAADDRERAKDIESEKAAMAEDAKPKWYKLNELPRWWANRANKENTLSAEGEEKIEKAALEQSKLIARAKDEEKASREKFAEEGAVELAAQEKRLQRDERGARNLELQVSTLREYNKLRNEGATEGEAIAGASTGAKLVERAEMMKFTRLVTVRSGQGDIARAAGFAAGEFGGTGGSASAINALHETVRTQNARTDLARLVPNGLGRDRP